MTPPAKSPAPSTPRQGVARWLNVVTTLALGAALLVVAFSAAPSLVRAGVAASEAEPDFPPPVRVPRPTLVPRDHPGARSPIALDDDPRGRDDADDGDRPPPRRAPRVAGEAAPERFAPDDSDEPGLGLGLRTGVILRPLRMRDRRSGDVIEEVRAGAEISILREDGEWALVVKRSQGELVTGWARRSEIDLR